MVSAVDGSAWFENAIVAADPSFTGPLLPRSAVGGTFFTVTSVVYSVKPPSLSRIRAFTV